MVYLSYLYKGDGNQGQSQSEIIGLANGTGNSTVKAWAGKQADQTKDPFRLGITRVSTTGGDIQWCNDPTVAINTVTLIVLKYDFDNLTASLFINPTIGSTTEPAANASDSEKGTAKTSLEYLMFKHNGKSVANFTVGGIRVSTTWAEAVAKKSSTVLPKLDAPVVGAASAIGAEGFTANWTAVADATGYKVNVYAGTDEIAEKTVVGQATTSAAFTTMPVATEMTYKVIALGDGVNKDNSDASAASAAFSTLAAPASLVFLPSTAEWTASSSDKDAYASGSYPSFSANGYDFEKAYIELSKDEEGKSFTVYNATTGESFKARTVIDKQSLGGMITLPAVASAARVDLYVAAGSDAKKLEVQQYNYTSNKWEKLSELDVDKALSVHSITPNAGVVKLRIANADNSKKQVYKVVTYTALPTDLAVPVVSEATDVTSSSFTANWSAVANAAGYRVQITAADTTIRATVANDVFTLAVDNLKPETEYTVKVAAIGDDAAYVGSNLSEGKVITTPAAIVTAIDELNAVESKARKVIVNGTMVIERNGEYFSLTGAKLQ